MAQHVRGLWLRKNIYWLDYFDNNGRRHRESTGVSDRKEAEKYLRKKQTEIAENKFLDKKKDQRIKFEDFAEKYLERHSMVNNRAWKKSDLVQIRSLKKHFSGYYLSEITKDVIDDFRAKKKKEGTKHGGINRILACLKSMYNRAIEWGDFDGVNPMANVKKLQEPPGRTRFLEKDDLKRLIECCDDNLRPYVLIAYNTGLRFSEQMSLKWNDLDFKNGLVSVHLTKSGKKRVLPMNEDMKKVFEGIPRQADSPYVFCGNDGKPNLNIRWLFEKAKKKAKITDFRWHDIRHTTASHLVQANVSLYTVKEQLGHSSIAMTERYAHLSKGHKEDAIAVLNGMAG